MRAGEIRVAPKIENDGPGPILSHACSSSSAGDGAPICSRSRRQSSPYQVRSSGKALPSPCSSRPICQALIISGLDRA